LAVPALWAYEVGNVLGIKAPRQASELLALLFALKLDELPAQRTCNRALSLVRKLRVTFYDAVYHAVALELNGTLVTADARYLTRAGSEGHLVLLGKWGEV
jgi:predicted nucleic acid-binding protein